MCVITHIIVCDANEESLELLSRLLRNSVQFGRVEIKSYTSPDKFVRELTKDIEIDIVIVDVHFGTHDLDGIELVRRLSQRLSDVQVIFTCPSGWTGRNVYTVDHLWCLPKPVNPHELDAAISRALDKIVSLQENYAVVICDGAKQFLRRNDITYIESRLHMLHYHLEDKTFVVRGKLSDVEAGMGSAFVRCHQSYLVNITHIAEANQNTLVMRTGECIPISSRRRGATRRAIADFLESVL